MLDWRDKGGLGFAVITVGDSRLDQASADPVEGLPEQGGRLRNETVMPDGPPVAILGVPLDRVTTAETVALIEQMIAARRPHYMVTANVDFLVQAVHDVELRRILFDAHVVLCDGTPLLWASRWLGHPLPERVAGSDLVPLLVQTAAEQGYRIFFLGGQPDAARQAVAKLRARYPALQIAGQYSPPYRELLELDHQEIRRRIRAAKPDLLFICFGCPKQEKWIAMHYQSLRVPVSIGVGGTIDFLAERLARAPLWMQRTGTEWIFRLAQEPRRLTGRYLRDCWYFANLLGAQWFRMRFRRRRGTKGSGPAQPVRQRDGWLELHCPDWLDAASVSADAPFWERALAGKEHVLLNMRRVQFIDSTGAGLLVRLRKRAALNDRRVVLVAPSPAVRRALETMKLWPFFNHAPDVPEAIATLTVQAPPAVPERDPFAPVPALVWRGEVTAAVGEAVWQATETFLRLHRGEETEIAINLRDVTFIDSTGAGLMIRAKKQAAAEGMKLRFLSLQPDVLNVIKLARLQGYLLDASGHSR